MKLRRALLSTTTPLSPEAQKRSGLLRGWKKQLPVAVSAALVSSVVQAQSWNMYDGYTTSYTIPYITSFQTAVQNSLSLDVSLGLNSTIPHSFTIDTGSTGLAVTSSFINGFTTQNAQQGWVFYNSSGLLLQGYFNTIPVNFLDANNNVITTALTPVLGVTSRTCLPGYSDPCSKTGNTFMLGVGVGRNTMGVGEIPGTVSDPKQLGSNLNGAPPISQAYNPFTNVEGMQTGDMRRGFIITQNGVQLGLTSATTNGFAFEQLLPLTGQIAGQTPDGPSNWQGATMAVAVNSGDYVPGNILMDTGLNTGFLHIPGYPTKGSVPAQTLVSLQLLGAGDNVGYSFLVGDTTNPQTPRSLLWDSAGNSPVAYLNSTLHTFAGFNYLYDADGGFLGLQLNGALPGTNAFLTPVLSASGTLSLNNDFTIGIATYLRDASTVSTSATATFNGGIMGPGSLTVNGTGTVVLNSDNNFAGGTNVQQGTLVLNGALAGNVSVAQAGTFQNTGKLNTGVGQLTNAGVLSNSGAIIGNVSNSGSATNNGNGIIQGSVQNTGQFVNNGTITGVFTNLGRLSGNGTVGDLAVLGGSSVAPGNSIGTLNVNGNILFEAGSTHEVELNASGKSDLIVVSGKAAINGGTIEVNAEPGAYMLGAAYPILTAKGGISGRFAVLTENNTVLSPFQSFSLNYTPNIAYLAVEANGGALRAAAATPNQASVAGALLSQGSSVALLNLVSQARDNASAQSAFTALSGEIHGSVVTAGYGDAALIQTSVLTRLRQPLLMGSTLPAFAQGSYPAAYTADLPGAAPAPAPVVVPARTSVGLWGDGFGAWGRIRSDGNAASLDTSTGGFVIGADTTLSDAFRVGLAGGFTRTSFDVTGRLSSGSNESVFGTIYGAGQWGAFNLRLGASYAWQDIDTSRIVVLPGFSEVASASYDGSTLQAFGELGYRMGFGVAVLEPFVGGSILRLHTDSFAEQGGIAALNGYGGDHNLATTTLGVRAEMQISQDMPLLLKGLIGWRHAYGDVEPDALLAFAGGASSFAVSGVPVDRDALVVEAGLDWKATHNLSLGASYAGQVGNRGQSHTVKGNLTWTFETR